MLRSKFPLSALTVFFCLLPTVFSFAGSQVRIVRLSDVEGAVQINRTPAGYEKAFLNLPVTQGNQVRTGSDGRAQIEFEDGSAIRLTPNTTVQFSQLSLADSGIRISSVTLTSGAAYFDYKGGKSDELTLTFGREKILFHQAAHLRVEMSDQNAAVAALSGEAEIQGPLGTVQLAKNRTAIFDLNGGGASKVAKNIEPNPYDSWDKQQDRYQQRYSSSSTVTTSNSYPYTYGLADLNYYGTYFNAPGYGMMWQPYFAGGNWDPFMNGAWALYPGVGYGWVSAYPWGWAPYHSGTWAFVPGRGWAWQSGGTWTPFMGTPAVVNAPANFVAPKPPAAASQSLVLVNRGPVSSFAGRSNSKLIIQNNSAGLGVPRGEVNNLAAISQRVNTQGTATARIHPAPVQTAGPSWGESQASNAGPGLRGASPSQQMGNSGAPRSAGPAIHPGPGHGSKN